MSHRKVLLVGDNPFHNISHFSQDRVKFRDHGLSHPKRAAELITMSLDNGANGFMFSVSETTLSILKYLRETKRDGRLTLYAIVPYAYEYVKLATQAGGLSGLTRIFARRLISSANMKAIASGLSGMLKGDPALLLETYLTYEIARIRSSTSRGAQIQSVLLHEVIVDMALALNLDWLFKAYIHFMAKRGYTPGFNTCNFVYLVNKLRSWDIDISRLVVAAPFNKVGFQMNPSREDCEESLKSTGKPILIAISILAAGYLKINDASDYIASLPNVKGVAVGVSKEEHTRETFRLLKKTLG